MKLKTVKLAAAVAVAAMGASAGVIGSGGTRTIAPNGDFVHTFTESGTFSTPMSGKIQLLIVGGGGGGGFRSGGGGGGGGVIYREEIEIPAGDHTIVIGAGGAGATDGSSPGTSGGDSSFAVDGTTTLTAFGGGGGGSTQSAANKGLSGGSAGGSACYIHGDSGPGDPEADNNSYVVEGGTVREGAEGQGHDGGCGRNGGWNLSSNPSWLYSGFWIWGGGGGGAGTAGGDAVGAPKSQNSGVYQTAGCGGEGLVISISGEDVCYGSGGGGGDSARPSETTYGKRNAPGGTGAGKGGSGANSKGGDATGYGCGGGGAGGAKSSTGVGGAGFQGIVIVRYALSPITPGETPSETAACFDGVSVSGDMVETVRKGRYTSYIFRTNGTITVAGTANADVLLVGGGGGGGFCLGGGGGAGGFVKKESFVLATGTYTVQVGAGGLGGTTSGVNGGDGERSFLFGTGKLLDGVTFWPVLQIAQGGGGGASGELEVSGKTYAGNSGASGGGGTVSINSSPAQDRTSEGGTSIAYAGECGNAGGKGLLSSKCYPSHFWRWSGGGGGAGEAGQDGWYTNSDNRASGRGGDGLDCNFSGENLCYAGGGAGGDNQRGHGRPGAGGGGTAGYSEDNTTMVDAGSGTNGLGGGGGGGWSFGASGGSGGNGGNGGSGVVIVRVRNPRKGCAVFLK